METLLGRFYVLAGGYFFLSTDDRLGRPNALYDRKKNS